MNLVRLSNSEVLVVGQSLAEVRQQLEALLSKLDTIPGCAIASLHLDQAIHALPADHLTV